MTIPGRTPNYTLGGPFKHSKGPHDEITLPIGSFVRPLDISYVPKHVLEDPEWRYFNKDLEMFCYTSKGIFVIPKYLIRET